MDYATITDIPCRVAHCPGLLRWAEAGYVPGYRICDCCGSHYAVVGDALKIHRRRRPSPAKIARMHGIRTAAARAQDAADDRAAMDEAARMTARWNEPADAPSVGVHGPGSVDVAPYYGDATVARLPEDYQALIARAAELTRMARVSSARWYRAEVGPPKILAATRDGTHVFVYQTMGGCAGPYDGWWSVDDLTRRCIGDGQAEQLTHEQRAALGVFR